MPYRTIFTILLIMLLIAGFSVRIPIGLGQPPESGQKQLDPPLLDKIPIKKLRAMDIAQRRLDPLDDVKKRLLREHNRWIKHRDTATAREQQKVTMRVTLTDAGSNRSDPWEFTFEAK